MLNNGEFAKRDSVSIVLDCPKKSTGGVTKRNYKRKLQMEWK